MEHFLAESAGTEPMTVPCNEVINLSESKDEISDIKKEEIGRNCKRL